jgi:putative oxidoreductase
VGLSGIGAGEWSLDHALGWFQPPGWWGLGIALVAGFGGALGLLVMFWRPERPSA